MDLFTLISLIFMFIGLYYFSFFMIIYFKNRKTLFLYPVAKRDYSISVIIPAYNEQGSIKSTIENVMNSNYKLKEVIVVDDGSKDKTGIIAKSLLGKYTNLKVISKKNSGKADSINQALKIARGELVAILDADSYPEKDAFEKMIGFFDEEKVAGVTSCITPKNKEKFIEKIQSIEYPIIAWQRKLLDYLDSVFVTPGGLSMYKKSALIEIKGFNTRNITEDIEVAWNLIHHGYKIRMCLAANSYTIAPDNFKQWKNQRVRWGIGGFQTLYQYRKEFLKKGLFGWFILPFVTISIFLGLFILIFEGYLFGKSVLLNLLFAKYSFIAGTPLIDFSLNFSPQVILIYTIFLSIAGFFLTMFSLKVMKEKNLSRIFHRNVFNLLFYIIVYQTFYGFIWFIAIFKILVSKNIKWGTK